MGRGRKHHFTAVFFNSSAKYFCSLIFALVSSGTGTAWALGPEEIRAEIEAQASQRHPSPPQDFWERLGPDALPVLKKMMTEALGPVERSWVIEGLGHFNDPEVGALLQASLKATSNDVQKTKLLSALIRSQGDAALAEVEPYLKDANPHVRIAVARGLRFSMSSGRAKDLLNQYLRSEKESWILSRIAEAEAAKEAKKEALNQRIIPKRELGLVASGAEPSAVSEKPLSPLRPEEWAGEWKGVYLSSAGLGSGSGSVMLSRGDGPEARWKAEILLAKKRKLLFKPDEIEVASFQTERAHWIRVQVKKSDLVFTGSRKPK